MCGDIVALKAIWLPKGIMAIRPPKGILAIMPPKGGTGNQAPEGRSGNLVPRRDSVNPTSARDTVNQRSSQRGEAGKRKKPRKNSFVVEPLNTKQGRQDQMAFAKRVTRALHHKLQVGLRD